MTPLGIIAGFVALIDAVAGLALVNTTGSIQVALTAFVIGFPVIVAGSFFFILWNRNYVFYPPTDFDSVTDVAKYVGAMRPPERLDTSKQPTQTTIIASASVETTSIGSGQVESTTVQVTTVQESTKVADNLDWWLLWRQKKYDEAVAVLQRELVTQGSKEAEFSIAVIGRILLEKKKEEGEAYYETVFRERPALTLPYVYLTYAYLGWDQFENAFKVIDRGLAAGADHAEMIELRARSRWKMGRLDEAIGELATELDRAPSTVSLHLAGGALLEEGKKPDKAAEWYRKALAIDPQNETALSSLGRVSGVLGRPKDALKYYKRLIGLRPDDSTYHCQLGNVYLDLGLNSKALAAYEKADELSEHKEAWILANIGNILRNRGFHLKAIKYLREAAAIEPGRVYTQDRLAGALRAAEEEDEKEKAALTESDVKALKEGE